jgi:hypothetical protein
MTNINCSYEEKKTFDLSAFRVEVGYFRHQVDVFANKYQSEFEGWGDFYARYANGLVDKGNLDYDEWAFLCEHFMKELTVSGEPPGNSVDLHEKPETFSGFCFLGELRCLIQQLISVRLRRR